MRGVDVRMKTDLSVPTKPDINTITKTLKGICQVSVEPDGVKFDTESFETETLMAEEANPGIRFKFWAHIDKTRIRMRIDIGFGDPITPGVELVDYPTILSMPAPRLRSYPKETVVAEKFHAIVRLGEINSRLKDLFDIAHLIRTFDFDGTLLSTAIQRTFKSRNAPIPADTPPGLSPEFANENQPAWEAFLRGASSVDKDILELQSALTDIRFFLLPIVQTISDGELFDMKWSFGQKWH